MKPGLAVLPLEVWADVFETPVITRQRLAEISNHIGNRGFTNKLQKLLHECGKHTLRYLHISSKQPDKTTPEPKISECRTILAVSPNGRGYGSYKECEFPETQMPENIKTFKRLSIRHIDDEILNFLTKIKQLFTNVYLNIALMGSENNMHVLFTHLIPMLGSIGGICCGNDDILFFEQHLPENLAEAKELDLSALKPAFIPTCLNWLNAPLDFHMFGPRFLRAIAEATTIFAIVDAVRKQFVAATTQSAFVILLQFYHSEQHLRADEIQFENATTKEELTIRNAQFKWLEHDIDIHYVEVLRHPTGAEAIMREWIKKRGDLEKTYNDDEDNKLIWIDQLTIGRITKQAEDEPINGNEAVGENDEEVGPSTSRQITKKKKLDRGEDEAGPSTPAKKMRKE